MPGPHVDKIYQAAQDKLYTQPMSDLQAQLATDQALAENMRRQTPEIGAEVFRDIENSNLTPQEKQEVHQKLAQYGMNQELAIPGVSTSPNTLLRGNTSYTNYSTAYLNHYAKGYVDSVRDLAMESVVKTPIPPSLVGKTNQAFLGVERVLGENLNGLPLRNSTQATLKKAGVPDDVIAKVDAAFETQGAKGTRPFDQGLQDDVDQALRQNGVDPQVIQSVNKSFNDQHAKLAKVTNLAGGQIPQQDMPDSGLLVDYLDKHGLSGGMTATDKTELAGVSVQDFQTLHQMQVDSAQRTLEASVKNLSELSPEAQGFLKSALGPIQDPTALNMAGASTLVLRLNSPGVSGDAANVKHHKDPSTSDHAIIAERGVKAVQRYVNTIGSGVNTRDYTSLGSNELHKNQTLKTQTLDSFKAVSQGQDLGNFSRSVGGPLTVSPTTRPQVDKLKRSAELGDQMNQALRAKLQPELQQIDAARAKLDKLNKPGINMEKFRAFFSKGGISGAKQATQQSLTNLQQDFSDKVAQWQKGIDQNKQDKQLKEATQKKQQLAQKDLSVSNGEAQNLLDALNKLGGPKSQVPKDLLLTPEEVNDLQKGLKNLKKATDKKKRDSLALSEDEGNDLLQKLKATTDSPKPGTVKLSEDQASDLMKKLNGLKDPSSGELEVGTVKLTGDQASDLMSKLNNIKGESQEVDLGSLKLKVAELDDLIEGLKEFEQDDMSQDVDDLSQEEGVGEFYLSDDDFADLRDALKNVSPEAWQQVDDQLEETDLSPEEIGDLIKELEELDLEGPKEEVDLDGMDVSPDHIQNMIDELDAFDPSQNPSQTRNRSKSVSDILESSKQGTEQKPKVGSNSLRSKHPELLHKEGEKPQGQTHKQNL